MIKMFVWVTVIFKFLQFFFIFTVENVQKTLFLIMKLMDCNKTQIAQIKVNKVEWIEMKNFISLILITLVF